MKKPSSKIREEILRLQEQLKAAETREAERIGRIALKAGLGDFEIDESELLIAFQQIASRFRGKATKAIEREGVDGTKLERVPAPAAATVEAGLSADGTGEA